MSTITCSSCNKNIPENSNFCEFCGVKVEKTKTPITIKLGEIEKKIIDHLEILGYEVVRNDIENETVTIILKHENRSNLVITILNTLGCMFCARYTLDKQKVSKKKEEILELLNKTNLNTIFTTFSIEENYEVILCTAFFPYFYDKKIFGTFIDVYENEIKKKISSKEFQEFA